MPSHLSTKRLAARLVALTAYSIGMTSLLRQRRRRRGDFRAFVLEYHDVSDGPESEGTISSQRFERHIRYLKRHYRIETFAAVADRLIENRLDEDVVALTFDDGYLGNARHAWPVLTNESVPATIFLTTGFLDGGGIWFDAARRSLDAARMTEVPIEIAERLRGALGAWPPGRSNADLEATMKQLKSMIPEKRDQILDLFRQAKLDQAPPAEPLSWDEAKQMLDAGLELGAHTVTHPVLPTLPWEGQRQEILNSRDRIAEATSSVPRTFSYPNGDYNDDSLRVVREAGFTAACTTRKGSNRPGADMATLRRIGVGSDPIFLLAARLSGLFDEEIRRLLKR